MKIEIELIEIENHEYWKGWVVKHDGKFADGLGYDEMLGLVAAITMPENRPTLNWLKTLEQQKAWREHIEHINDLS